MVAACASTAATPRTTDLLPLVCDAAQYKQGKYLPGSRIPIHTPAKLEEVRPDYVVVFPWNIIDEVMQQNRHVRDWGGKFVTAVPTLEIR
nr:methyltransferase C-terminal domain-containing protein [Mycobacterium tuberculosis]